MFRQRIVAPLLAALLLSAQAKASVDSIGPQGINSVNLGLTGAGISIGQVELERPGDPDIDDDGILFEIGVDDDGAHSNSFTDPKAVFIENDINPPTPNSDAEMLDPDNFSAHATWVAGVMISSDVLAPGVAPQADLYASAGFIMSGGPLLVERLALSSQFIAEQDSDDVRAINISLLIAMDSGSLNGNNFFTKFIDWSATRHDTLYVTAGSETTDGVFLGPYQPTDNFNGIKVGASSMRDGVYRQVASYNVTVQHPDSNRTLIDILAPGTDIEVADRGGGTPPTPSGTSLAAPHVTGTVALLQQYGDSQAPSIRWDGDHRKHEVMKAVLMNSADKLIDDGSWTPPGGNPVPVGGLLGMERTVVKEDGTSTWFDSTAYGDGWDQQGGFTPLDEEMGAGHLNANRAKIQLQNGEFDPDGDDVPAIGWDYDTTGGVGFAGINRYKINEDLSADSFISITLAWDRKVDLVNNVGAINEYDWQDASTKDDFQDYTQSPTDPQADSAINNLTLWLLPRGAATTAEAIAQSDFNEGTVQHLFFQIPNTGPFEFWVEQRDSDASPLQNYGIAWWAKPSTLLVEGDFTGDGMVDNEDLVAWKADFGTTYDGNDFLAWQRNYGFGVLATPASVPEPSALMLGVLGLVVGAAYSRWRSPN